MTTAIASPEATAGVPFSDPVVSEARDRFMRAAEWEANFRERFINDYKFANGDSDNGYQWPNAIRRARDVDTKPCLTLNVVAQHNFQVVNEMRMNKSAVKLAAAGNGATKEAADVWMGLVRRIEYQSSAGEAYTRAAQFQVDGGYGVWRIVTDWVDQDSFQQEIFIQVMNDPLCAYFDPDAQRLTKSDSRWAFVFDNVPLDKFEECYPRFMDKVGDQPFGVAAGDGDWISKDHIRLAEYFRKVGRKDQLASFVDPKDGQRKTIRRSRLPPSVWGVLLDDRWTMVRDTWVEDVEWKLIAGDKVIDETIWPGKNIPLIACIGQEVVIEGVMDRKGLTRAMKDAQRMYNYNAAMALDTPIPTLNGWTTIGQIQAGDQVLDENGLPVTVIGVSQVHVEHDCYRVKFDDGSDIVADAQHLWFTEERGKRKAQGFVWQDKTICTADLQAGKHYIKLAAPLDLDEKKLPIHPYLLGLWLGDGNSDSPVITAGHTDLEETRVNVAALGYTVGQPRSILPGSAVFTVFGVRDKFIAEGLLHDKHIPADYLRASYKQRLSLLQGLMDSDGHFAPATNQCVFVNGNAELAAMVRELLATLGIKSTISRQPANTKEFPNGKIYTSERTFRIQFTADPDQQIFRLERKRAAQQTPRPTHWRRTKRFAIVEVERVESVPVKCLTLDTPSHLYLAGRGMIPTHNSSQVETVALQSKIPWIAPVKAIEEFETYWGTANIVNHSVLPYNHVDDDGNQVPAPQRQEPPKSSEAYQVGMDTAFNQMMMTSGQWQNQMGMQGNERTGAAIKARQGQGDVATYHFRDNYEMAIVDTGKQLVDLIPWIYDTQRVIQIQAEDGEDLEVQLDPTARQAYMMIQRQDQMGAIRVLNPQLGKFDVMAQAGPAYGTRREQTQEALRLIMAEVPGMPAIIGDIFMRTLDFREADEAAARMKRMVPQQALGTGPTPQEQQLQQQVAALQNALSEVLKKQGQLQLKLVGKDQMRDIDVYKAETDRFKALAGALGVDPGGLKEIVTQLIQESLQTQLTPIISANRDNIDTSAGFRPPSGRGQGNGTTPPVPGARQAPDGQFYINDPTRPGKYLQVAVRGRA